MNFAAGVETQEGFDEEDADEDWNEADAGDLGAYPSEHQDAIASRASPTSAGSKPSSSAKSTNKKNSGSAALGKRLGLGKARDQSSSQGQGSTSAGMKQGTLSSWRSASLSKSTPPPVHVQPEPPLEDDVLDLTGTDDEDAALPKPGAGDIPTRKLLRPRRDA